MADKLAIVFDGPPANESGRFVEVELNGAGVSFGEWQENGDYWELVLPDPYAENARLRNALHESHLATIGLRKKVEDISQTIVTAIAQQEEKP